MVDLAWELGGPMAPLEGGAAMTTVIRSNYMAHSQSLARVNSGDALKLNGTQALKVMTAVIRSNNPRILLGCAREGDQ